MLVIHSEIRGVIDENIDFARRATEGDLVMDPAWPDFLKATYRHDRNDMSQLFSRVLASPKKQHIKTLPVDELNAIMSLLQAVRFLTNLKDDISSDSRNGLAHR